jgi:two-component system NtrC family response regulator
VLYPQHLPERIRIRIARTKLAHHSSFQKDGNKSSISHRKLPSLKAVRETALTQVEEQYLQDLMLMSEWNIHKACQISGLRRARLYELLKKYDISR